MRPPANVVDRPSRCAEAGYSLAEVAVALALLSVVAAPLAAVCIQHLGSVEHHTTLAALNRAQVELERLRGGRRNMERDRLYDDGPWTIRHRVRQRDRLIAIEITVTRRRQQHLSITLTSDILIGPDDVP